MKLQLVTFLKTGCVAVASLAAAVIAADAQGAVDQAYVRSLAAPGKMVLVVEYYDGNKKIVGRHGFVSASGFKALSPTNIRVDDRITLHLYGLEPCQGDLVNRQEGFMGTCSDFATKHLATLLHSPRVVFCRAFLSEEDAPIQDATCFGYYNYPGALDTVDNIEEQLISVGALRLSRKADGSLMRSDLAHAEKIGQQGFGMWADPRIRAQ